MSGLFAILVCVILALTFTPGIDFLLEGPEGMRRRLIHRRAWRISRRCRWRGIRELVDRSRLSARLETAASSSELAIFLLCKGFFSASRRPWRGFFSVVPPTVTSALSAARALVSRALGAIW